jgi:hypothetical protein
MKLNKINGSPAVTLIKFKIFTAKQILLNVPVTVALTK